MWLGANASGLSAAWRWGYHSQLGLLSRPKRQVALRSAPRIGVAQAQVALGCA